MSKCLGFVATHLAHMPAETHLLMCATKFVLPLFPLSLSTHQLLKTMGNGSIKVYFDQFGAC